MALRERNDDENNSWDAGTMVNPDSIFSLLREWWTGERPFGVEWRFTEKTGPNPGRVGTLSFIDPVTSRWNSVTLSPVKKNSECELEGGKIPEYYDSQTMADLVPGGFRLFIRGTTTDIPWRIFRFSDIALGTTPNAIIRFLS